MKIALIHDHLTCKAGGEQVALTFHKAFPEAPIYTLAFNPEATFPEFKNCDVRTSWFNYITYDESILKKLFFPLGILAMRSIYLDAFDVILISGTHCGKYVRFSPKTIVITYCFTPFRLAWNPHSYSQYTFANKFEKKVYDGLIKILKYFDKKYAKRTNFFIAMTNETKYRIECAYNPDKKIEIINPPVNNLNIFETPKDNKPKEYFLLVSRLEYYKKVDLAIEAFNKIDGKLIIVGQGSKETELKELSDPSKITFLKNLTTKDLAQIYGNCRAFIFPQYEDYGLTALEANASGRPVIAFRKGGILDTQIEFNIDKKDGTAVFFDNQNVDSLIEAIFYFQKIESKFSPNLIRKNAERFSEKEFINSIKTFVKEKASTI